LNRLTRPQAKTLRAIGKSLRKRGIFPTIPELSANFAGVTTSAAASHLDGLVRKGYVLRRYTRTARSHQLTRKGRAYLDIPPPIVAVTPVRSCACGYATFKAPGEPCFGCWLIRRRAS